MAPTKTMTQGSLIPAPALAADLGVHARTLRRWMIDDAMGFPKPIVLKNRNFFHRHEIEAWKAAQLRKTMGGKAA